jgi:integrase/recombinase XerD
MTLSEYLYKHHQPSTVKIYLFEIRHYLKWMGEQRAQSASYGDVLSYLEYLRKRYDSSGTVYRIIHAIKRYYYYLQAIEKRKDHPCRLLQLKDNKRTAIQTQDLLNEAELTQLLEREERFASYALRNKLILSLLIHQALLTREICGLKVSDIDLDKGQIYVRETVKTNARTLPLKAEQVMLIYRYLSEYRARFIKQETEALIISGRGQAELGEGVHYLVTTMRKVIPHKKLTPMTIRQSVIANKLKAGQDLRIVQVFAGHRQPSSTEAYRTNNLEELRTAVAKYHPLK